MTWRIYRLPGSRRVWHIDSGAGTPVVNVLDIYSSVPFRSVDTNSNAMPRAWFEVGGCSPDAIVHLVVFDNTSAQFVNEPQWREKFNKDFLKPALCPATCGGSCTQLEKCGSAGKCLAQVASALPEKKAEVN